MEGKAGLVTGAASGIGRACAIRFAQEGAAVVVADLERARAGGEETVRAIEEAGGSATFFACDVAKAEDSAALVATSSSATAASTTPTTTRASGSTSCSPTPTTRTSTASSPSTCAARSWA